MQRKDGLPGIAVCLASDPQPSPPTAVPMSTTHTMLITAPATLLLTKMKLLLHVSAAHSMQCTRHAVALLQAAAARELRALPNTPSDRLLVFANPAHLTELHSAHPQQQPQTSLPQLKDPWLLKALQSGSPAPHPTPPSHPLPSSCSRGRQTAVRRYEPHLQPSQVQVDSQRAGGTGNGGGRGSNGAELAQTHRQQRQAAQAQTSHGFASPHVKALVGEVMVVDNYTVNDTHQLFCDICRSHRWRFYLDVRGE